MQRFRHSTLIAAALPALAGILLATTPLAFAQQTGPDGALPDGAIQEPPARIPEGGIEGQTPQTEEGAQLPDSTDPVDPCTVDPETAEGETDETPLAETLDDCDGVLQPAPQGDTGLVEPAPEEGRTPVIPPETLPGDPQ